MAPFGWRFNLLPIIILGYFFVYGAIIFAWLIKFYTKNKLISITISTFSFFIGVFFLRLNSDIKHAQYRAYVGTEVYVNDSLYNKSNDSIFYIGNTDKYVFIYNTRLENTTILPSDKVSKIILKKMN